MYLVCTYNNKEFTWEKRKKIDIIETVRDSIYIVYCQKKNINIVNIDDESKVTRTEHHVDILHDKNVEEQVVVVVVMVVVMVVATTCIEMLLFRPIVHLSKNYNLLFREYF